MGKSLGLNVALDPQRLFYRLAALVHDGVEYEGGGARGGECEGGGVTGLMIGFANGRTIRNIQPGRRSATRKLARIWS
jgi:hypothetical protein